MIIDIQEIIRRTVDEAMAGISHPMVGFVDSYNPKDHTAKIKFPTEVDKDGKPRISGWIPHAVSSSGASSWVLGPSTGDQCVVVHLEGDAESPVIIGYLHNSTDTPPSAESSQGYLRHTKSGNYFALDTDGSFKHFHESTGNYAKMDKEGNFTTYISDPKKTQHYIGGDPKNTTNGTPVFAALATVMGPSPFAQARVA